MPKDTKTLGNSKARACESLGFVHKKGCARVLTQPLLFISYLISGYSRHIIVPSIVITITLPFPVLIREVIAEWEIL